MVQVEAAGGGGLPARGELTGALEGVGVKAEGLGLLTAGLREAALEDLGELIASFQGSYRTGPDIGTGPQDMVVLRRFSPYAYCAPEEHGGTGNSGGPTATGVLAALHAGARHVFGDASCTGRTVVISGFGSVGSGIAADLAAEGAHVVVSDVEQSRRDAALSSGYGWVEPDQALSTPADILVPAAGGGVLDAATVPRITAPLVVGPANNQLTEESVADALAERGADRRAPAHVRRLTRPGRLMARQPSPVTR